MVCSLYRSSNGLTPPSMYFTRDRSDQNGGQQAYLGCSLSHHERVQQRLRELGDDDIFSAHSDYASVSRYTDTISMASILTSHIS